MILEFINVSPKTPAGLQLQNERFVIRYSNISNLEGALKKISLDDLLQITTLVIWGGHGSQTNLCGLTESDLQKVVQLLPPNTLQTIVLDTCESALHAHIFKSSLSSNGAILCHIGIGPGQILRDYKTEVVKEENIRTMWIKLMEGAIDSFVHEPGNIIAFFPAIYRNNSMNFLYVEGMTFEENVKDAFTQKDLTNNVKKTNAQQIDLMADFKQLL